MKLTASVVTFASFVLCMFSTQGDRFCALCYRSYPVDPLCSIFGVSAPLFGGCKPHCPVWTSNHSTSITQGAEYSTMGLWLGRTICTDKSDLCEVLVASDQPCRIPTGTQSFYHIANVWFDFLLSYITGFINLKLVICNLTHPYHNIWINSHSELFHCDCHTSARLWGFLLYVFYIRENGQGRCNVD